jgi:hypothetical protein
MLNSVASFSQRLVSRCGMLKDDAAGEVVEPACVGESAVESEADEVEFGLVMRNAVA